MKKNLLFLFLIFAGVARAQQTAGDEALEMNDSLYNSLESGNMLFGDTHSGSISKSYSLRAYCPLLRMPVLGGLGWTAAVSKAMGIQLGMMKQWTREKIEKEIFSPYFLYDMLPKASAGSCKLRRDWPRETQQLLLTTGNVKNSEYPGGGPDCSRTPSSALIRAARQYQVRSFTKLFNIDQTDNNVGSGQKQFMIKRSLLRNHPVVVCIMADRGFLKLGQETWIPDFSGSESVFQAVVVVGYDDQKQAFEIAGSSGKEWGKDGFAWIRYSDLIFSKYGFEMMLMEPEMSSDNTKPQKTGTPKPSDQRVAKVRQGKQSKPAAPRTPVHSYAENKGLKGHLVVNTVNEQGDFVPVQVQRDNGGFYQALGDYQVSSQFQIIGTGARPGSYIYVLSIDPAGRSSLHYPYGLEQTNGTSQRQSPLVMDAESQFVIPQPVVRYDVSGNQLRKEQVFIKEYAGTDWLVTLFCDRRLDNEILTLVQRLSGHNKDFLEQFREVFSPYLLAADQVKIQPQKMKFETVPGAKTGVAAVILRIDAN